jgi:hypothetical protein
MNNIILFLVVFLLGRPASDGMDAVRRERLSKEIAFDASEAGRQVVVDNVFGSIRVVGVSGDRVRMTADKTIRARSNEILARAQEAVRLDVTNGKDGIRIVVDGPFRGENGSIDFDESEEGYTFVCDFVIEAPSGADIRLNTIGEGDISVEGIRGDFKVDNVNGAIDMNGVSGSGRAYALNRDLTVRFTRNPERDCRFGSLNGDVRLYFRNPLSADFRFKTFNGEGYSDFPMTYPPSSQAVERSVRRGKTVYRTGGWTPVRVGRGGPSIDLDGFNGDLYILKH